MTLKKILSKEYINKFVNIYSVVLEKTKSDNSADNEDNCIVLLKSLYSNLIKEREIRLFLFYKGLLLFFIYHVFDVLVIESKNNHVYPYFEKISKEAHSFEIRGQSILKKPKYKVFLWPPNIYRYLRYLHRVFKLFENMHSRYILETFYLGLCIAEIKALDYEPLKNEDLLNEAKELLSKPEKAFRFSADNCYRYNKKTEMQTLKRPTVKLKEINAYIENLSPEESISFCMKMKTYLGSVIYQFRHYLSVCSDDIHISLNYLDDNLPDLLYYMEKEFLFDKVQNKYLDKAENIIRRRLHELNYIKNQIEYIIEQKKDLIMTHDLLTEYNGNGNGNGKVHSEVKDIESVEVIEEVVTEDKRNNSQHEKSALKNPPKIDRKKENATMYIEIIDLITKERINERKACQQVCHKYKKDKKFESNLIKLFNKTKNEMYLGDLNKMRNAMREIVYKVDKNILDKTIF